MLTWELGIFKLPATKTINYEQIMLNVRAK